MLAKSAEFTYDGAVVPPHPIHLCYVAHSAGRIYRRARLSLESISSFPYVTQSSHASQTAMAQIQLNSSFLP